MDEGNPEKTDGTINWVKRELVYQSIQEVIKYQQAPYSFPVVEPLFTFLVELAQSSNKLLYDLSVYIEPREKQP